MSGRPRPSLRAAPLLAMVGWGCWHAVRADVSGHVDVAPRGVPVVRLVYLGVGGWIMERGGDQVVTAPLFTRPSFVRTGLRQIRSDPDTVDRYMSRYDVSGALAILVGHAHYDHLMDVPRVASRHAPHARILGNRTVKNTLGTWSGVGERVEVVNRLAGDRERAGTWISLGKGVRVMPLRSDHAPHFDGHTLYQGVRNRPLGREPTRADEWLEGETFAFLVDFMAGPDSVAFRIYYQDAVAAPPRGFAPDTLIARRPVDVAILVPATFDQVDWDPEALIENLRPRWVLLGHWEDFFRSVEDTARSVMLTDIGHFRRRLERVHPRGNWLPDPWTEFRFPLGD